MEKTEETFSTWELFLGEIRRNIKPQKTEIEDQLAFLTIQGVCDEKKYKSLVSVRFMAAYEQAINEYLHPPADFKQANIKAELIHFGSIFEGLLEVFLVSQFRKNRITAQPNKNWLKKDLVEHENCLAKKRKGTPYKLSFNQSIECLAEWNKSENKNDSNIKYYVDLINQLRNERNKIHVNQMVDSSGLHEEYRLVEIREKWDGFVSVVKDKI